MHQLIHAILVLQFCQPLFDETLAHPYAHAYATRAEAHRKIEAVLKTIPSDAREITEEQYLAINAAGDFRDSHLISELMRIVLVEHKPVEGIRDISVRSVFDFDGLARFPAAQALEKLGWVAAISITTEVNDSNGNVDAKRLEIYGRILKAILNYHTINFLKEERSHAPDSVLPIYDKLLEMQFIKMSKSDFKQSEPTPVEEPLEKSDPLVNPYDFFGRE